MFRGAVSWAGAVVFVLASLISFLVAPTPSALRPIAVAGTFGAATDLPRRAMERVRDVARAEVVLGAQSTPVATIEPIPEPTVAPTPQATPVPTAPPVVATLATLADPPTGGIVVASWYGPGFYGNRTACGQVYTPEIIGVAHRTLRCGTMLVLEYRGRTMTVPVIDRGPYIAGRTLDLSNATRIAMGCPDLCTLSMRIAP